MALKDMVKNAAKSTMDAAQNAVQNAAQDISEQGAGGVATGFFGGYSEMTAQSAHEQYGMYLMQGEQYTRAFALLRDKMLFTDKRIVFIDHQGATGKKTAVESINLDSIVLVRLETGGFGFDHAEIDLGYVVTPHGAIIEKHLEFPNGFDVQGLYTLLESHAHANVSRMLS